MLIRPARCELDGTLADQDAFDGPDYRPKNSVMVTISRKEKNNRRTKSTPPKRRRDFDDEIPFMRLPLFPGVTPDWQFESLTKVEGITALSCEPRSDTAEPLKYLFPAVIDKCDFAQVDDRFHGHAATQHHGSNVFGECAHKSTLDL
jgi:hypothetical protein